MMDKMRIFVGLGLVAVILGSGVLMTVYVFEADRAQVSHKDWQTVQTTLAEVVEATNRLQTGPGQSKTTSDTVRAAAVPPSGVAVAINHASQSELETLNGIGPARAIALIEARETGGPFRDLDDIRARVSKIPASILEDISSEITFD